MYSNQPKEMLEARPASIRFAKEIAEFVNKKYVGRAGAMGCLIAAITLQNLVTSILVEMYPPGDKDGMDYLDKLYDQLKRDAIARWYEPDLKVHFDHKHRGKQ